MFHYLLILLLYSPLFIDVSIRVQAVSTATPVTFFPTFTFPSFPTLPTIHPFLTTQSPLFLSPPGIQPINPVNSTMQPINITLNPEALMSVPEIIEHWGYPVEEHRVTTKDGYILVLHRIPHGKKLNNSTSRPVVFLQHGLLCTSSIWLLNLPHQSAGFIYADAGFDVWLGNMRGNTYSRQHVYYNADSPEFWKFSWEEMAQYDLPSMIDYVLKETNRAFLYYVGHSQGTLTMFAKLSSDPPFAKKIRKFFALAPVARMSHVQGMFHYLGQVYEQFNMVYRFFGDNEFLSNNIFTRLLTDLLCQKNQKNPLCENFIFSVSGPNSNQFNSSRIGIYLSHNPAGTSSRNMLHFAQMVKRKTMSSFDRGREANMEYYGTPIPPEYDLRKVKASTYLFYSDFDWLADAVDVEGYLIPSLPKRTLKMKKKLTHFNHNDFLWGLRARREIYEPILNIIKLDNRRIEIQRGLQQYFQTRPSHISDQMGDAYIQHLNNSIEFD